MFWFDLDNSPHVLIFKNIFKELGKRGLDYLITARDFAQTRSLLELFKIKHFLIGKYGGKSKVKKVINLLERVYSLKKFIKNYNVKLAISHGSRAQTLAAYLSKIPSVVMSDYEHTEFYIFNTFAKYLMFPSIIPKNVLREAGIDIKKVIFYNGFKENLYLDDFVPDANFRNELGVDYNTTFIIIRPPALTSNYHNSNSEKIFLSLLNRLKYEKNTFTLLLPRTEYDKNFIINHNLLSENIMISDRVYDGLQLIYSADIVFSGGGTMNREAALLGTEVYSFFTGKKPYIDTYLESIGRLKFLRYPEDVKKIEIQKKGKKEILKSEGNLIHEVVNIFLNLI